MCLVVKYVKGVAYKLFDNRGGFLRSPIQGDCYSMGKWIKDLKTGTLPFVGETCSTSKGPRIVNISSNECYDTGFHCWPSLEDALAAVKEAKYLYTEEGVSGIYRINYKKVLAQGIDETTRPALVVRYMKILEKVHSY